MGYVSSKRWQNGEGTFTDELAVNPEFFLGYPLIEVMQTLAHEQCHIFQNHFGKPGRRAYHNKEWARIMNNIGLIPSHTGQPGGRQTGERMADYVLMDGPFHRAAGALLEKGFALPWFDRQPVPTGNYNHAVYTADHRIAQIEPDPASLPLYIPLGSAIQTMTDADTETQSGSERELHAGETPASGQIEDGGSGSEETTDAAVSTSASITLMSHVRLTQPVVPAASAAKRQPTRAKYSCECGFNLWGKPGLSITCNTCQTAFEELF
jgi:predicted SprT family Zn-dependent metalloprotease